MRLENLYENFGNASPEEQAQYISEYRLRRAEDLSNTPSYPKTTTKTTNTTKSKIQLTDEEQVLMKLLGVKKKDMIALRALSSDEEE